MTNAARYTRAFVFATAFSSLTFTVAAQYKNDDKRIADHFYAHGDYYSAARYYERYLSGHGTGGGHFEAYAARKQAGAVASGPGAVSVSGNAGMLQIQYRLAESYRQLNDYTQAQTWYRSVSERGAGLYPLASFWLAICFRTAGQYDSARLQLQNFLQAYTASDGWHARALKERANLDFILEAAGHPVTGLVVKKMGAPLNAEGASYAPCWIGDSAILFTSTRAAIPLGKKGDAAHPNALYISKYPALVAGGAAASFFRDPDPLAIPLIPGHEEGVATSTPDGRQLFFTVWTEDKEGKRHAQLYTVTKKDKEWSIPMAPGAGINGEGFDTRQPQVTADGSYLLFSSDRPGGQGGFDIWYAPLKDGQCGQPVNAGAAVNTIDDEQAPFYHAGSHTLVFSSNGHPGMGGFDLYSSQGDFSTGWSKPQNMGMPLNSEKDDIYFIGRGANLLDDVVFSSDRSSSCCLELFSASAPAQAAVGLTSAEALPQAAGQPADSQSSTSARPIEDTAPGNKVPDSGSAADTTAAATSIFDHTKKLPIAHLIQFQFASKELTSDSYAYLDDIATYLRAHPGSRLEIAAYTDGIGTEAFNIELSRQRAESCASYLEKNGIGRGRLVIKGYGKAHPLEKEMTPEGKDNPRARELNRRVEMTLL